VLAAPTLVVGATGVPSPELEQAPSARIPHRAKGIIFQRRAAVEVVMLIRCPPDDD
jgi:hypothetical protein